jgi:hypothetical protein
VAISGVPLAYCSNVHPAVDLHDLRERLDQTAVPAVRLLGRPVAVGLWLPKSALEGVEPDAVESFRGWTAERGLTTTTMNAFPFGDFHAKRVKEKVYEPDWTNSERSRYTNRVADFLAALLPENSAGSISTLPCCYRRLKPNAAADDFAACFMATVEHLASIRERTGRTIRLAIEPEPGCFLERTGQAIDFIQRLKELASSSSLGDAVREHVGVCFDVCHAAVMFENPGDSVRELAAAEIRIPKIQISSAIELRAPADRGARKFLSQFVEERYLHQTIGRQGDRFLFAEDLTTTHALMPSDDWRTCESWRVHFHVPIHKQEIGPLHTTSWAVEETLAAAASLPYAPDLEVETYTWDVLPAIGKSGADDLAHGLAAELKHAQSIIDRLSA